MEHDAEPLVPVRMLAQYSYCPRLAYLEWVQKEWKDNYFTEDGRFAHRRVDAYSEATESPTTRSLNLTAPREGLVTKLDILEQGNGCGVPVEYKRGRTPEEGPRFSERVQLCAQGLALRENGWSSEHGYLYYSQSNQRTQVEFTEELVTVVRALKQEMVEQFRSGKIPQPLVNDNRCGDCSLNSICLPEEVNFLRRNSPKVRPLWAAHEEGHPIHVTEHGARVGLKGEELLVRLNGEELGRARLIETSQVCLHGNSQISTQALRACARNGTPVLYFSYGNWFVASLQGMPHKNVELRRAQFKAAFDSEQCLQISRAFVTSKIANQRVLIRRNGRPGAVVLRELKKLRSKAHSAPSLESLLGLEGLAAKYYFSEFSGMLKAEGLSFGRRNRRPPTDPVNTVLSFCYALLVKEATVALHTVGFDPYQGFYHQSRYGRPSLALDLMEEFRPLIADSVTITLFNTRQVGIDDFFYAGHGCGLRKRARKRVVGAFERRMGEELTHPLFGYRASYRRVLVLQARLLARHLMGELDHYPGLETR